MLVAISGKIGSGKDEVAKMMSYIHFCLNEDRKNYINFSNYSKFLGKNSFIGTVVKHRIYKFADSLKESLAYCLGVDREELESRSYKSSQIDWLDGMTVRELLQKFATGIRHEVSEDFWANALLHKYKKSYTWFISDLRYINEATKCKELGGILVRVIRPGIESETHESETQLDNYQFDYVIENDGTLEDLFEKCKEIIVKL